MKEAAGLHTLIAHHGVRVHVPLPGTMLSVWVALARSHAARDCVFLCLMVLLSLIFYVDKLGFYSDDWEYLGGFAVAPDQSFLGFLRAAWDPTFWMRPVQLLYTVTLAWLFGLNPLGYHVINGLSLMGMTVLLYVVLDTLKQPRILTLTVPLVYVLLPHYSTDRFWISADGANLCIALYFLSLYADLQAVQSSGTALIRWKILSLCALLASTLMYEYAVLLFFLNPLLTLYLARRLYGPLAGPSRILTRWPIMVASTMLTLALIVLFKLVVTTRLASEAGSKQHVGWFIETLKAEAYYNLGTDGLYLPRTAWTLLTTYPNRDIAILGLGTFVFSIVYIWRAGLSDGLPGKWQFTAAVAVGVIVWILAYAIFLPTNETLQATPTGQGNRTAIAATAGVALILVGAAGLVASVLPVRRLRTLMFSVIVAGACSAGVVVINILATLWVAAAIEQHETLDNIRRHFPTMPPSTALILDGVCRYKGPAVIFEGGTWDLAGALRTVYGDASIRADVVTRRLKVTNDSLMTEMYGFTREYHYDAVLLYNLAEGKDYRFADADEARQYFAGYNPDFTSNCPVGVPGYGAPVV